MSDQTQQTENQGLRDLDVPEKEAADAKGGQGAAFEDLLVAARKKP
jgi:hypothetical protein